MKVDRMNSDREMSFKILKAKFDEAFSNLEEHESQYGDGDYKNSLLSRLLINHKCKLNYFNYYERTSDGENKACGLLTPLSEDEVKQKMKDCADSCGNAYNHYDFLESIKHCGIYYQDEFTHSYHAEVVRKEILLNYIDEKDIFSPQKYSEIIKEREEAAELERKKKEEATKIRIETQEKAELKRLKAKYD